MRFLIFKSKIPTCFKISHTKTRINCSQIGELTSLSREWDIRNYIRLGVYWSLVQAYVEYIGIFLYRNNAENRPRPRNNILLLYPYYEHCRIPMFYAFPFSSWYYVIKPKSTPKSAPGKAPVPSSSSDSGQTSIVREKFAVRFTTT